MAVTRPTRRKDPAVRHHDGGSTWAKVLNKKEDRHYVLVNMNSSDMGPGYYKEIGYRVEVADKDGPRLAGGTTVKDGEEITMRGMLLMSCDMERYREIQRSGPDGNTGWDDAERVERKIIDKERGGIDKLRGLHGRRYFDVRNETTRAERE
jgi:hypothetical protein